MEMIAEKEKLRERIETFAFSCAEKLRKQNSCCRVITVLFIPIDLEKNWASIKMVFQ